MNPQARRAYMILLAIPLRPLGRVGGTFVLSLISLNLSAHARCSAGAYTAKFEVSGGTYPNGAFASLNVGQAGAVSGSSGGPLSQLYLNNTDPLYLNLGGTIIYGPGTFFRSPDRLVYTRGDYTANYNLEIFRYGVSVYEKSGSYQVSSPEPNITQLISGGVPESSIPYLEGGIFYVGSTPTLVTEPFPFPTVIDNTYPFFTPCDPAVINVRQPIFDGGSILVRDSTFAEDSSLRFGYDDTDYVTVRTSGLIRNLTGNTVFIRNIFGPGVLRIESSALNVYFDMVETPKPSASIEIINNTSRAGEYRLAGDFQKLSITGSNENSQNSVTLVSVNVDELILSSEPESRLQVDVIRQFYESSGGIEVRDQVIVGAGDFSQTNLRVIERSNALFKSNLHLGTGQSSSALLDVTDSDVIIAGDLFVSNGDKGGYKTIDSLTSSTTIDPFISGVRLLSTDYGGTPAYPLPQGPTRLTVNGDINLASGRGSQAGLSLFTSEFGQNQKSEVQLGGDLRLADGEDAAAYVYGSANASEGSDVTLFVGKNFTGASGKDSIVQVTFFQGDLDVLGTVDLGSGEDSKNLLLLIGSEEKSSTYTSRGLTVGSGKNSYSILTFRDHTTAQVLANDSNGDLNFASGESAKGRGIVRRMASLLLEGDFKLADHLKASAFFMVKDSSDLILKKDLQIGSTTEVFAPDPENRGAGLVISDKSTVSVSGSVTSYAGVHEYNWRTGTTFEFWDEVDPFLDTKMIASGLAVIDSTLDVTGSLTLKGLNVQPAESDWLNGPIDPLKMETTKAGNTLVVCGKSKVKAAEGIILGGYTRLLVSSDFVEMSGIGSDVNCSGQGTPEITANVLGDESATNPDRGVISITTSGDTVPTVKLTGDLGKVSNTYETNYNPILQFAPMDPEASTVTKLQVSGKAFIGGIDVDFTKFFENYTPELYETYNIITSSDGAVDYRNSDYTRYLLNSRWISEVYDPGITSSRANVVVSSQRGWEVGLSINYTEDSNSITDQRSVSASVVDQSIFVNWGDDSDLGLPTVAILKDYLERDYAVVTGNGTGTKEDFDNETKDKILNDVAFIMQQNYMGTSRVGIKSSHWGDEPDRTSIIVHMVKNSLGVLKGIAYNTIGIPIDKFGLTIDRFNKVQEGDVIVTTRELDGSISSIRNISQAIAHEFGHTIGIIHIKDTNKLNSSSINNSFELNNNVSDQFPGECQYDIGEAKCLSFTTNALYHAIRYGIYDLDRLVRLGLTPGTWEQRVTPAYVSLNFSDFSGGGSIGLDGGLSVLYDGSSVADSASEGLIFFQGPTIDLSSLSDGANFQLKIPGNVLTKALSIGGLLSGPDGHKVFLSFSRNRFDASDDVLPYRYLGARKRVYLWEVGDADFTPTMIGSFELSISLEDEGGNESLFVYRNGLNDISHVGFTPNQKDVLHYLKAVIDSGDYGNLDDLVSSFDLNPASKDLASSMDALSAQPYLGAINRIGQFAGSVSNSLLSCRAQNGREFERSCFWAKAAHDNRERDATTTSVGSQDASTSWSMGQQWEAAEDLWLGVGGAVEVADSDFGGSAKSDRTSAGLGASVKHRIGNFLVSGSLAGAISKANMRRIIQTTGPRAVAESSPEIWSGSGRLKVSYLESIDSWYARPSLEVSGGGARMRGLTEEQAGDLGLVVDSNVDTFWGVSPGIEIGLNVDDGLQVFAAAKHQFQFQRDSKIDARLIGGTNGLPGFENRERDDPSVSVFEFGASTYNSNGFNFEARAQLSKGETTEGFGAFLKASWAL